jgi:transcriptional regulator with XRE-family HTH domain
MRGNHLVREMRRRAGLTQAELAERTGTTQSAIARLERGQGRPTLERLSTLARACDLDIHVHLVDADDHDWTLVDRSAASHPDTRVAGLKNLVRFAEAGRAAMADARRRRDAVRA